MPSHSFVTKISKGNKVEFIFENINLPFTEPLKHGYIAFKIKTLPTLTVGSEIKNKADIYFDYNFPVATNEATSTFQNLLGVEDISQTKAQVSIYPNPVKEVLQINTQEKLKSVELFDVNGRVVQSSITHDKQLNVSNLKSDVYLVKIVTDKGSISEKLIKE